MTFRYIIEDLLYGGYYNELRGKLVDTKFAATWYTTEESAIEAYKDKGAFIIHKVYRP